MRHLCLVCILVLACSLAAQQAPQAPGLTPKTGAVFDNLYTNVFFGLNFRFPKDWEVSFVASDGSCAPECVLLEVRAPGYPKVPRSVTLSAEAGPASRSDHLASAALILEKTGSRKVADRELEVAGHKLYRTDYRSQLVHSDLYQAVIAMPLKSYLVVFSFAAESRKQLDGFADGLIKDLTFTTAN